MSSKQEILEELRRSRLAVARDMASIAQEVSVVSKIRRSVTARPLAWLGGAAALGYILAGPKTRKASNAVSNKKGGKNEKVEPVRRGLPQSISILFNLVKFLLPIVRPALSAYAAQRLGELSARFPR